MSLAAVYGNNKDRYLELIQTFPLRHIKNDPQLDRAIRVMDALLDKPRLNRAERDYLDALSTLVEVYEEKEHPIPVPTDADMLRHLIDARGVTQSEVAAQTKDRALDNLGRASYSAAIDTNTNREAGRVFRRFAKRV